MKKIKIICIIMFCIIVLLFSLSYLSYMHDIKKINEDKEPSFILYKYGINDGGTMVYYGFGYQIVDWHQITDDGSYIATESHWICGFRHDFNIKEKLK